MSDPYTCPHCGSDRVRSFKAVTNSGTLSDIADVTTYDSAGNIGHGTAYVDVSSKAAKDAAAPVPRFALLTMMGWGSFYFGLFLPFGAYGMGSLISRSAGPFMTAFEFLWPYILGFIAFWGVTQLVHKLSNTDLAERQTAWAKQWMCDRCGESFEITP